MLKIIIEKEIRDLIGSTKFAVTFGACAILILISFYVGATRHNLYRSQYDASSAEILRSMEGIADWNDLEGTRIFLPPQPLASLVSGVSNDISRTAKITGRGEIPMRDSRYNEDPIYAVFRFIDLEFIFKVILSLFAILLGYNAVSGEKEQGTLRLSFANAVPRHTYITGKLIGSFIAQVISILIAISIGTIILPLMGIRLSGDEWTKLSLIVFTGLLYFGTFLTLSVFISAMTHRSSNSFLILLVIWVLCIHIVPRVSVLLAARSIDVPTIDEITYQQSKLSSQLLTEFLADMDKFFATNNDGGEMDMIAKLNKFSDSLTDIRETKMHALTSRLNEDRFNKQRIQEQTAFAIARVSPATSLSLATSYLAGTSIRLKNHFRDEAEIYQKSYGAFMTEKTGFNSGGFIRMRASSACGGGDKDQPEKPEAIDPKELPNFDYNNFTTTESIKASIVDIGILFIFNLLFFAGAFVAFGKYDLR